MGQYFEWVNYTKRQYLQNDVFPEGLKYAESCFVGAPSVDAVSTLLAGPWKGDLVAFTGEYVFDLRSNVTPASYPGLSRLLDVAIDPCDIECEFADITGRFTYARGKSGYAPPSLADDDTAGETPYTGPFDLEIAHHRFMVNETKGCYYDRQATQQIGHGHRFDPLPLLLGTAIGGLLVGGEHLAPPEGSAWGHAPDGLWVGDLVYPSDARPGIDCEDVSALYTKGA